MRYLDKAIRELKKEKDPDTRLSTYHCAVIVSGGRVISIGRNKYKYHEVMDAFSHSNFTCTIHAEADAVIKARGKVDLTGCKIYVARLGKNGKIGLSAPCKVCTAILQAYGIKKAFYTVDENTYAVTKL